jgi:hypothetical protein
LILVGSDIWSVAASNIVSSQFCQEWIEGLRQAALPARSPDR